MTSFLVLVGIAYVLCCAVAIRAYRKAPQIEEDNVPSSGSDAGLQPAQEHVPDCIHLPSARAV